MKRELGMMSYILSMWKDASLLSCGKCKPFSTCLESCPNVKGSVKSRGQQ